MEVGRSAEVRDEAMRENDREDEARSDREELMAVDLGALAMILHDRRAADKADHEWSRGMTGRNFY
jgi:hypothetical protein